MANKKEIQLHNSPIYYYEHAEDKKTYVSSDFCVCARFACHALTQFPHSIRGKKILNK